MTFKNPFEELGLTPAVVKTAGYESSLDLAERVYRTVSRYRHPDTGGKPADFAKLEEAMRFLRDPSMRREFFDEYAGKTGATRLTKAREQIDELKLNEGRLRDLLSQAIGAPYTVGSVQNLARGTLLLIQAHPSWILLSAEEDGLYLQYLELEDESQRAETFWPVKGGVKFVQVKQGRAYSWSASGRASVEDGFWRVASDDPETGTQLISRLHPLGRKARYPEELVVCLNFETGKESGKMTALKSLNSTGRQSRTTASALSYANAEAISFTPVIGGLLIATDKRSLAGKFQPVGTIVGGVIP